jgi:hypothetical protein
MKSRAEIVRQLEHFKGDCPAGDSVNAMWIAALEWVLGNEQQREAHARLVAALKDMRADNEPPWPEPTTPTVEILRSQLLIERIQARRASFGLALALDRIE